MPIILGLMGVLMTVLRTGASQVVFDVVGRFQAGRLIKDAKTQMTVFNSLLVDGLGMVQEAGQEMADVMDAYIDSVLPSTIAIADATIELQKFVAEGENFEELKEQVMEIGASFGYTGDQALMAASKMAQLSSVLGQGQTAVGAQLGFEFGLISGMETDKAMQRLVNLNQQIKFMTKGTTALMSEEEKGLHIRQNTLRVLDQLNTVENRSAATMEQVTFVMNQFASQANLTGESISFMAAQSAVLIEAGEEQGKGGRALKAIYARLGADTSGAATALQDLGIATHDASGGLRPLSDILGQLNEVWPEMNRGQQQNITQLIAGNRHYTRLIKLIEGYDRMLQLQHEGEMALMPALEEVNIRLDSNINKYREAEAQLSNYQAELGDALLPTLTKVTEKQALFTASLSGFVEAGGMITPAIFGIGKAFQMIGGPLFNTFMMFRSLEVASGTLASITRALQGEEIILATAYGKGGAALVDYSNKLGQLNVVRTNEIRSVRKSYEGIKDITHRQLEKNRKLIKSELSMQKKRDVLDKKGQHRIAMAEREISTMRSKVLEAKKDKASVAELKIVEDNYTETIERQSLVIEDSQRAIKGRARANAKSFNTTKKLGNENAKLLNNAADRREAMDRKESDRLARQAQNYMKFAGGVTAAGGAIMMLARNEEQMQVGMALSTAGIVFMTAAQVKNTVAAGFSMVATKLKDIQLKKHILTTIAASKVTYAHMRATQAETGAIAASTLVIKTNTTALATWMGAGVGKTLVKKAAFWTAWSAAVVSSIALVSMGSKKLLEERKKLSEGLRNDVVDIELIGNGAVDIQKFREMTLDDTISTVDMQGLMAHQLKTIKMYENDITADGKQQLNDARDLYATYKDVLTVKQQEAFLAIDTTDANKDNLELMFDTIDAVREYEKQYEGTIGAIKEMGNAFSWNMQNTPAKEFQAFVDIFDDLAEKEPAMGSLIQALLSGELGDVDSVLDLEAWKSGRAVTPLLDSAMMVTDTWQTATASLVEFANAREELFYGMNANNITGDLIRQVKQTGVENLIANTEVVMTNNFNGMTTREVANEILRQISDGASGIGVNINASSI